MITNQEAQTTIDTLDKVIKQLSLTSGSTYFGLIVDIQQFLRSNSEANDRRVSSNYDRAMGVIKK
jgi:hypothetical protein